MPSGSICFWSLLSIKDLSFIYISSWLSKALGPEQSLLLGTSFFDYVHPQDQDIAKRDLSDFVKKKTLTCSVTRCQYDSVSTIRRKFQASAMNSPKPFQASNYPTISTITDDYVIMDVGMSVVSHDIVLACFHSESGKPRNGVIAPCGEAEFTNDELNKLSSLLHKHSSVESQKVQTPPATPHLDNQPLHDRSSEESGRIFQILDGHSRNLIFTWPSPNSGRRVLETSTYNQDDFPRLFRDLALTSKGNNGLGSVDAQPNCLRPITDKRILLLTSGKYRQVESVVIPYGNITFACFQVLPSPSSVVSISLGGTSSLSGSSVFKQKARSAPCSPASNANITKRPRSPGSLSPLPRLCHLDTANPPMPSQEALEFGGDACRSKKRQRQQISEPSIPNNSMSMKLSSPPRELPTYREYPQYQFQPPPQSKEQHTIPDLTQQQHVYYASHGSQQPSSTHFVPNYSQGNNNNHNPNQHNSVSLPPPPSQQPSSSQADPIQPQVFTQFAPQQRRTNVVHGKKCESCHTSSSPEWRRGPTGHKTLCNACGLRYSRTIARENRKREQAQREQEQRFREQREREERAREKAEAMMMQRTIEPFGQYRPSNSTVPPHHHHHHHQSPPLHPNHYRPTTLPMTHHQPPPHSHPHPHHQDSSPSRYATSPMQIKMEHPHPMHPSPTSIGDRGFSLQCSSQQIYYDRSNVGGSSFQGGNRGDNISESNGHSVHESERYAMNTMNMPPKAYYGRAQ